MGDLSERCMALFHDVKLMEDENLRLTNALAKRDSEIFSMKSGDVYRRLVPPTITSNASCAEVFPAALPANKTKDKGSWDIVEFKPKASTLEDDVRKFLGLPPHEKSMRKNDKRFIASLDKAYGKEQVDAMIKQLRNA